MILYRCALVRALAGDVARITAAVQGDWTHGYAALIENPGSNDSYRTADESLQELYKALSTGLEFTADTRLGQPLGSYDHPRPERAETRRSGRALRNVELSLASLRDLSAHLATALDAAHPDLGEEIDHFFDQAGQAAERLDDADLAGVATTGGRFKVEALQQMVHALRDAVRGEMGPALGIATGFNALDGD